MSAATTAATALIFLLRVNYYYHYASFLMPFLALTIGVAFSRIGRIPGVRV
ncbi:hypothetical protein [Saccharopolyspora sp. 5N708]|uniref:hypothetical protein n=1 Tax=Saccharopolyspora sp. 5N708 TaxID=3457424 RepID=UPI003FD04E60